jgi:hypothetical protein
MNSAVLEYPGVLIFDGFRGARILAVLSFGIETANILAPEKPQF